MFCLHQPNLQNHPNSLERRVQLPNTEEGRSLQFQAIFSACMVGAGTYGAVGFAYGPSAAGGEGSASEEEGSSDFDDSDEEETAQLDDKAVDNLAANLGIEDYSSLLHRVEKQEADLARGDVKRAK